MGREGSTGAAAIGGMLVVGFALAAHPVAAQPTVERRSASFEGALAIAKVALTEADSRKCTVAVAVVDAAALPLVLLRQDGATQQFVTGASRKAWTAVNLRGSTRDLLASATKGDGDDGQLVHVENALLLMGGIPLRDGDTIVGGVGVAGCVAGPDDDAVARSAADAFGRLVRESRSGD